ncbi:MAG: hypothetical protein N2316_10785 [Spirochaetes bacterium]|nr:hypothetical protein [Spirochaetota bacterium]
MAQPLPEKDKINYYVEPVEIEIYLKKAGKVRTIIKDLYIELVDVKPINKHSEKIFDYFIKRDEPIDLMEVMNVFPEYMTVIFDSYYQHINLYEKLSMYFKNALAGSIDSWRLALYFVEMLLKYEPTIASANVLGDFQTHNLNYLIRKLNSLQQKFLLEDSTVEYLIKRYYQAHEGEPRDPVFDKLVELWRYNVKEKDLRY